MKDIILSAYKEKFGEEGRVGEVWGVTYKHVHLIKERAFTDGWNACQEFMDEQEARDEDWQEELMEQEGLQQGDF